MNFLNLGIGELLGLVGAVSIGVTALYLLDRSKRRQVVSTLRFWTPADVRSEMKHRRKIQQPLSLLLQLISLALLLLAIAGPQFGVFDRPGRDHVVILDTSAWLGAVNRQGTLLDQSKADALAYLRTLPKRDRVMLIRADALATPATAFETNHDVVRAAISQSQPSASALNLTQALQFAQKAQSLQGQQAGEIVLVGAARVDNDESQLTSIPPNFRFIPVEVPKENIGLRQVALRRSATPDSWDIFVSMHNYGVQPRAANLSVTYADSPAGARRVTIAPGADAQETFTYKEKVGGWVEARLNVNDAVPQDDRAVVQVPSQVAMKILIYSDKPALLHPLFDADPRIDAQYLATSAYDASKKADALVFDRFTPPSPATGNIIWIEPGIDQKPGAPIAVRSSFSNVALTRWNTDSTLAEGLYTKDVTLQTTEVFNAAQGDVVVADSSQGPIVVAKESPTGKQLFLGFNPSQSSMKYELATPLLIANALRWTAPDAWRRREMQAGRVGTISIALEKNTNPATIKVLDENNKPLPFALDNGTLRFFSGQPGTIRVQTGDREMDYSLTLPDLAEASWQVPAKALKGVPKTAMVDPVAAEIWPWLALLGALGLAVDWYMFGRNRTMRLRSGSAPFAKVGAA